jgi:hypothetical protein
MDTGLHERGLFPELADNVIHPCGVNKIFGPRPRDLARES